RTAQALEHEAVVELAMHLSRADELGHVGELPEAVDQARELVFGESEPLHERVCEFTASLRCERVRHIGLVRLGERPAVLGASERVGQGPQKGRTARLGEGCEVEGTATRGRCAGGNGSGSVSHISAKNKLSRVTSVS